ncbi:HDIG domain-containing protein [Candidatus Amesbacteria bacterium]|nr:HDIG domain-containing protein [Candidatus Amesbacteria bacterium]MBI2587310.1 HDIG domain-containing protein [Candidatus Amesbacteria bacterium]
MTRDQAWKLLTEKMQNQNLRRHCLSVEAVMRALAQHLEASAEKWGIVGLLHDGDYEFTKDDPANHAKLMANWVRDLGETDKELLDGIESHGFSHLGGVPRNKMEWSLFCCDELTGLIVACALVLPSKHLSDLSVQSVLKKFPQKSFAAGAKREDILHCESALGIKLADFIAISLSAMQSIASEIGL